MSKPLTKEDVILHKKRAIKKLNNTLEKFINDPTPKASKHLKKANLISYWLESYSTYLEWEENFDPKRIIAYKRGDVIKVDFGFNIGSEHGGLHYAVVLDKYNKHNSPVVTVVPLSSGTKDSVYERDVFLGNELYKKMTYKNKVLMAAAREKLDNCFKLIEALTSGDPDENADLIRTIQNQQAEVSADIELLEKYKKEIDRMKQGSVAMIEQITTVSKIRIHVPRESTDILYGISFSAQEMELINQKISDLFLN